MSLTVIKPGLLATLQDLGRYGYQKYGVVVGGAMDQTAVRIANWLVGNDESEAVLELTLTGTVLRVERATWIAICGADMGPVATADISPNTVVHRGFMNGADYNSVTGEEEELPLWRPIYLSAGTTIRFGDYRFGCRTYVAMAGGFQAHEAMGSRSTYMRGAFGGLNGRALQAGDKLEARMNTASKPIKLLHTTPSGKVMYPRWHAGSFAALQEDVHTIRLMPGAHMDQLTREGRRRLYADTFQITVSSDRMGYRLQTEQALILASPALELLSEPISLGTVQLPPDGHPIVLLAERQTTGGYPRIGQVVSVDIPIFAQLKPGDSIRFRPVDQVEAEELLLESEWEMDILRAAIQLKLQG